MKSEPPLFLTRHAAIFLFYFKPSSGIMMTVCENDSYILQGENKCPSAEENGVSILHGNALAFVKVTPKKTIIIISTSSWRFLIPCNVNLNGIMPSGGTFFLSPSLRIPNPTWASEFPNALAEKKSSGWCCPAVTVTCRKQNNFPLGYDNLKQRPKKLV